MSANTLPSTPHVQIKSEWALPSKWLMKSYWLHLTPFPLFSCYLLMKTYHLFCQWVLCLNYHIQYQGYFWALFVFWGPIKGETNSGLQSKSGGVLALPELLSIAGTDHTGYQCLLHCQLSGSDDHCHLQLWSCADILCCVSWQCAYTHSWGIPLSV